MSDLGVFIGYDSRFADAFNVARASIRRYNRQIPIEGIVLDDVRAAGLYTRPTIRLIGALFDELSARADYDGAMSTEFAISRFLTPHLQKSGWALFMDCDMMLRANIARAFDGLDPNKALYCVKHDHRPAATMKMDGQAQTQYPRKNWSSFMIFNCAHPANAALTIEAINTKPGIDLHRFYWLKDEEIGELPATWNCLIGHTQGVDDPKNVHFTDGIPSLPGYHDQPFAAEWFALRRQWTAVA